MDINTFIHVHTHTHTHTRTHTRVTIEVAVVMVVVVVGGSNWRVEYRKRKLREGAKYERQL